MKSIVNRHLNLLNCPKTRQSLTLNQSEDDLELVTEDGKNKYTLVEHLPILIDFNTSINDEATFFSAIRTSNVKRRTKNVLSRHLNGVINPISPQTKKNVKEISGILNNYKSESKPLLLFIGRGTIGQGMNKIYNNKNLDIISFDVYGTEITDFIADAHNIPLKNETVDCIIIQAVLEHVLEPDKVEKEILRVLKFGGIVYSETPFMQQVHEGAYDFTLYTDSGHRFLFRSFKEINSGMVSSAGTQLLWSIEYFFRSIFRSEIIGKVFKLLFFWLQYFDLIVPMSYATDSASGCFFLGEKLENFEFNNIDIIKYYKGSQQ